MDPLATMRRDIRNEGYVHLPGVVPRHAIDAANRTIDEDLRTHYDPDRLQTYIHQSFCPKIRRHPSITGLLRQSAARRMVDALLPFRSLHGSSIGQIAIRHAHEVAEPVAPDWHIDGVPTRANGMLRGRLWVFTALVGIFLTPCEAPDSGNFTVFPKSHTRLNEWFTHHGRKSMRMGRPTIEAGSPRQLLVRPGDMVIANYLLAHAATPNASSVQRRAVFFRLGLPRAALRPYHCVTNPWVGWRTPLEPVR